MDHRDTRPKSAQLAASAQASGKASAPGPMASASQGMGRSPARNGGKAAGPSMFAPYEWWIAWRYLRAKKKENFASIITVISFLGIMLGVATLIVVMAVMNGFRADLLDRILGLNGHMAVERDFGPLEGYDAVADAVRAVPGVKSAAPLVEGGVMAVSGGVFNYALIRGLRPEDLQTLSLVADNIVQGDLNDVRGSRAIAIGRRAALNYGVGVGDKITLISPQGPATPFGTAPRQKAYRVAAIFEVGLSDYDASVMFMPLDQARLYFGTGEGVHRVDVMIEDPDLVGAFRQPLADAAGPGTRVTDWKALNSTLVGVLQVERNMIFIILSLIVIIAALNIVSGLVMLVKDKGRDIAVLRTMGASSGTVLRIFLITGAAIGVVGTVAGFGLGLLVSAYIEEIRQAISWLLQAELFPADIYYLNRMTAEINNGEVTAVLIFALTLSFLAPLYPAWRAARLDPVVALRYE